MSGLRNPGKVGNCFPDSLDGVTSFMVLSLSSSLHGNLNLSSFKNGGWMKGEGQLPIMLSLIFMFSLGAFYLGRILLFEMYIKFFSLCSYQQSITPI